MQINRRNQSRFLFHPYARLVRAVVKIAFLFSLLLLASPVMASDPPKLTFVRDGGPVTVDKELASKVIAGILETVLATGYDSSREYASSENWSRAIAGDYFLLTFTLTTPVTVLGNQSRRVTEVLIPLSKPDLREGYYLLRDRTTGEYWSVTKYHPGPQAKLICDPKLQLRRYGSFCKEMRRLHILSDSS